MLLQTNPPRTAAVDRRRRRAAVATCRSVVDLLPPNCCYVSLRLSSLPQLIPFSPLQRLWDQPIPAPLDCADLCAASYRKAGCGSPLFGQRAARNQTLPDAGLVSRQVVVSPPLVCLLQALREVSANLRPHGTRREPPGSARAARGLVAAAVGGDSPVAAGEREVPQPATAGGRPGRSRRDRWDTSRAARSSHADTSRGTRDRRAASCRRSSHRGR